MPVFFSVTADASAFVASSGSSSMTKAFSNSEGSGPLTLVPSSLGLGRRGFVAGDSVREFDLCALDDDLETGAPVTDFWRACSSAMRLSIAPLIRFRTGQQIVRARLAPRITWIENTWNPWNIVATSAV